MVLPILTFLIAFAAMVMAHFYVSLGDWNEWPWTLLGLVPAVIGIYFASAADQAGKRAPATDVQGGFRFPSTGVYAVSRNPLFFGLALVLLGVGVSLGSFGPLVIVPLFVGVVDWQFIAPAERSLEAQYGDDYRDYCRRVRRWI